MSADNTFMPVAPSRGRGLNTGLWVIQVLLAVFFLVAAAGPKLFGQSVAVEMFDQIGLGQWFRFFVGTLELAGAIGLLVPRLAGLAALGLIGVMVGAVFTQLFVLDDPLLAITPVLLGVVLGLIAWGRGRETRALLGARRVS
ncbi:MAG TPA: DoxX family protein [Nocardioidaceae bacterium]|nr:DoxX family protein [Nocardioidaceae bacterium]